MATRPPMFSKFFITMMAIFMLLITCFYILVSHKIHQEIEDYEKHLGKTYVVGTDTLQITDYKYFEQAYILSNGVKIHRKLIPPIKNEEGR